LLVKEADAQVLIHGTRMCPFSVDSCGERKEPPMDATHAFQIDNDADTPIEVLPAEPDAFASICESYERLTAMVERTDPENGAYETLVSARCEALIGMFLTPAPDAAALAYKLAAYAVEDATGLTWHADILAAINADAARLAAGSIAHSADWSSVVATYEQTRDAWNVAEKARDEREIRNRPQLPPKPQEPKLTRPVTENMTIAEIKAIPLDRPYADYEVELAVWNEQCEALRAADAEPLRRAADEANERYYAALSAVTNFPAVSAAVLSEKLDIIFKEHDCFNTHDGDEPWARWAEAIASDVQRLASLAVKAEMSQATAPSARSVPRERCDALLSQLSDVQLALSRLETLTRAIPHYVDEIGGVEDKTVRHFLNEICNFADVGAATAEHAGEIAEKIEVELRAMGSGRA
jgi:hypothetical protein